MKLYHRKPETVEAIEVIPENEEELRSFGAVVVKEHHPIVSSQTYFAVNFPTSGSFVRASEGDFLVRTGNGYQKIPAGEFWAQFEPVV